MLLQLALSVGLLQASLLDAMDTGSDDVCSPAASLHSRLAIDCFAFACSRLTKLTPTNPEAWLPRMILLTV